MNQESHKNRATALMRNPHLLALSIVIIVVGGYSALQSMPRLEDPVITNRNPLILTLMPGASAERIEAQITEKIEDSLKEIPEIKILDTTSRSNLSFVAIELEESVTRKTNEEIFSKIRDKLEDAVREFPEDALDPIFDDKRGAVAYTVIAGLVWEAENPTRPAILNRKAEELADVLRNVAGTDIVRIYGQPQEQILVEVDPAELAGLGLSIRDLTGMLQRADVKLPAGTLENSSLSYQVEVKGEFDSAQRVASVPLITSPEGFLIRLGDIATVTKAPVTPPEEISRSEGRETILVAARVQEDQRVDQWSTRALEAIEGFRKDLGEGVAVDIVFDQNEYTSERLGALATNLFLGALVVFAVIFFSMGWRSSLIVGSTLPLTAALTLFLISLAGGKLHQMSIFGMIIALGLLIDNAIVVTDEINQRLQEGKSRLEAVSLSLGHLFIPLLSSTLTTIFAFAPILLLPGNAGDFVGSIGSSVITALACSFFISMTIIASLAGIFGSRKQDEESSRSWLASGLQFPGLERAWKQFLEWAYHFPLSALGFSSVIPMVGFLLAATLGVQFFPRTDRDMFEIQAWLPRGSSIERTEQLSRDLEAAIREYSEVEEVHWLVGGSFPSVYYNLVMNKDNSPQYTQGIIDVTSFRAVKRLIPTLQERLDREFPQAQIVMNQFAQGPPSEADVEFRIFGPNVRQLQNLGESLRLLLAEHPDILHTQVTMPRGQPKVAFEANEEEALRSNLSLTSLALQLQGNLSGFQGGSVLEDVEELPVRIRFASAHRQNFEDLRAVNFIAPGNQVEWIPLNTLGDLKLFPASGGITRRNGERVNIIRGYTRNQALPIEVSEAVLEQTRTNPFELPDGYRLELGGDTESQSEAVGNLTLYLPVLVVLTVSILILSFRSVFIAIILGGVALLSVGVGLLATWAYGLDLSFNTILGSLGLVGLAFNSSIVVLASILSREASRSGDPEAMAQQVVRSTRHLVSTTLTTIGSFIPLLVFVGGDFWPPLAIVLAGGVGGSTLLAMVFTPSVYRIIQKIKRRASRAAAAITP